MYIFHELISRTFDDQATYNILKKKQIYINAYIHVVIAMIIFSYIKFFSSKQWKKKQLFNTIFNSRRKQSIWIKYINNKNVLSLMIWQVDNQLMIKKTSKLVNNITKRKSASFAMIWQIWTWLIKLMLI
jgi:hypothetical protein